MSAVTQKRIKYSTINHPKDLVQAFTGKSPNAHDFIEFAVLVRWFEINPDWVRKRGEDGCESNNHDLAKALGVHWRTVQDYVKYSETAGMIEREIRGGRRRFIRTRLHGLKFLALVVRQAEAEFNKSGKWENDYRHRLGMCFPGRFQKTFGVSYTEFKNRSRSTAQDSTQARPDTAQKPPDHPTETAGEGTGSAYEVQTGTDKNIFSISNAGARENPPHRAQDVPPTFEKKDRRQKHGSDSTGQESAQARDDILDISQRLRQNKRLCLIMQIMIKRGRLDLSKPADLPQLLHEFELEMLQNIADQPDATVHQNQNRAEDPGETPASNVKGPPRLTHPELIARLKQTISPGTVTIVEEAYIETMEQGVQVFRDGLPDYIKALLSQTVGADFIHFGEVSEDIENKAEPEVGSLPQFPGIPTVTELRNHRNARGTCVHRPAGSAQARRAVIYRFPVLHRTRGAQKRPVSETSRPPEEKETESERYATAEDIEKALIARGLVVPPEPGIAKDPPGTAALAVPLLPGETSQDFPLRRTGRTTPRRSGRAAEGVFAAVGAQKQVNEQPAELPAVGQARG